MLKLENKTIAVAGGHGLIGRAVCEAFKECGANVYSLDIKPGADFEIDITDSKRLRSFFDNLNEDVYGWVNCTYPPDLIDHAKAFNISTPIVANRLRSQGLGGVIILLSSVYGLVGPKSTLYMGVNERRPHLLYSVCKNGIIGLARYFASTHGRFGIRVHAICPGDVEASQSMEYRKRYIAGVPIGRMAKPEDIAWPIVFLTSPLCEYVTGSVLPVDGGMTVQ